MMYTSKEVELLGRMIAIIDYGAGNLQSVKKALDVIGASSIITKDAGCIRSADAVILPGVGSFADAMDSMRASGLTDTVVEAAHSGKPFLGICLGLQLLFETSEESPGAAGLGVLQGDIRRIPRKDGLKVPHIGWNSLAVTQRDGLFRGIPQGAYVYFVHSYYLKAAHESEVAARTEYGVSIDAAVQKGNLCATQFHPEKSGRIGLQILRNFVAMSGKEED